MKNLICFKPSDRRSRRFDNAFCLWLVLTLSASAQVPSQAPATAPKAAPVAAPAAPLSPAAVPSAPTVSTTPPAAASTASGAGKEVTPTQSVVINLINRLVQRGVLAKDDATDLIKQAEQDAATAKAQAQAQAQASSTPASTDVVPEGGEDAVRVMYVPDNVRAEMREQIKNDVMTQAREENWAQPRVLPDWLSEIHPMADLRVRYELDQYPGGNANTGEFTNFNAINTGSPYDTSVGNNNFPPLQNVDQNRERLRLRARVGFEALLKDNLTFGFRIGTGQDDSPVSQNQTEGYANNAQGGNFSKDAVWLDRAFVSYQYGADRDRSLTGTIGRFDNPFLHTSMIWSDDLAFEGIAFQARYRVSDSVVPFLTGGAFPIYNTDYNFASNQPTKFKSEDKWLYAIQAGAEWQINDELQVKGGMAYYDFDNIEGKLSSPFTPLSSSDQGNTDDSRPSFAQNGNTYMALRDIELNANNNYGGLYQYQYYGLASPFREAAITGQIDYSHFDPFHLCLRGEAVQNVAFDKSGINNVAVNNRGGADGSSYGGFVGGDYGYLVKFILGHPILVNRWDWNISTSYRYVESDATVDAFSDSDFGANMAGTNLEGYTVGGSVAFDSNIWLSLQYMSADAIVGPPYRNDVLQMDVNFKF